MACRPSDCQGFQNRKKVISLGGRIFDEYKDYHKYTKQNYFVGKLKGIFLSVVSKIVFNSLDLIFSEGSDIKKHLIEQGVKTRIEVVNNGIDVSRFRVIHRHTKNVLFFGRFSWENRPSIFLEIVKKLPDFSGKMVGYGPLESELRQKAKDISNVKIFKPVPWEKIPSLLNSADFVVLPFKRIGGISQTVTESMAAGKVVLTTETGDLGKVIVSGKNGFFFSDAEKAASLINSLGEKKKSSVEKQARETIEKKFSWKGQIGKYIEAYHSILCSSEEDGA